MLGYFDKEVPLCNFYFENKFVGVGFVLKHQQPNFLYVFSFVFVVTFYQIQQNLNKGVVQLKGHQVNVPVDHVGSVFVLHNPVVVLNQIENQRPNLGAPLQIHVVVDEIVEVYGNELLVHEVVLGDQEQALVEPLENDGLVAVVAEHIPELFTTHNLELLQNLHQDLHQP